jgi:hypothetical protein
VYDFCTPLAESNHLFQAMFLICTLAWSRAVSFVRGTEALSMLIAFQPSVHFDEESIFSILIALVFGFSTLNILGLVTRRFENRPSRLNVGEILALTAMALSVCFLGLEMLQVFHVFPIKLER